MPQDNRTAWLVALGLMLVAFITRVANLAYPNRLIFDETYYPKDAWSLWHFGYERSWPDGANDLIIQGQTNVWNDGPANAVHPPMGKILIGLGEVLFGMNSFGWRIMAVIFGTLLIGATVLLVRRLARSTMIGAVAGILMICDGLVFTMSRIGLLDIFQAFFIMAGVLAMVVDRDWFRGKLADHLETLPVPDLKGSFGPVIYWRPWRLVAGLMFGCAVATKWNTLYVLAAFCLLTLAWDISARHLAGGGKSAIWGLLRDGIPAFVLQVVVPGIIYLLSYLPWLLSTGGYMRDWGENNPDALSTRLLGKPLASLIAYQINTYNFHTGDYIAEQTHPYATDPWSWPLMVRGIGFDAQNGIQAGQQGCPTDAAEGCLRVINALGTPLLWWIGCVALVLAILWWIGDRDWRFSVPVVGFMSVWLPWFQYDERPLYFFYAILLIPFTVTAVALMLGKLIGPAVTEESPPAARRRRLLGSWAAGIIVVLVVLNFAYFWPIYTDGLLTREQWLNRMWFHSWI